MKNMESGNGKGRGTGAGEFKTGYVLRVSMTIVAL